MAYPYAKSIMHLSIKTSSGLTPNYIVKVREDILAETDGPMLKYCIKSLNGNKLLLPGKKIDRSDEGGLKMRFDVFLKAV
ncbi:MAG: hypothetical protein JXK07_03745 [Spirochaetes bacterium]|nr:hypothetical protein [Spirochaetota bacterium]